MAQKEIILLLENKELSAKDMEQMLSISIRAIRRALHQLIKYNEIEINYDKTTPIYKLKRKKRMGKNPQK